MTLIERLQRIAVESYLKEGNNCQRILERSDLGIMSESDFEKAYPHMIAQREIDNARIAAEDAAEKALRDELMKNEPTVYEKNRAMLIPAATKEVRITKSFCKKFISPWSSSRWGVRKADVVNEILKFKTPKCEARMYCSATYTEKSGCHGYQYQFYVDFKAGIIAKVASKNSDAFDFTVYSITQIIEAYKMV